MKKFLANCFVLFLAIGAGAAELDWMTSLPDAQKKAKADNKIILMDFTGSDWCIWCKRLKAEIFDTKDFADYAKTNLVLVEVDFPAKKQQTAELKKANAALQEKYGVQGYPTLIILDGDGKKIGEMNYMQGGPQPFITRLNKLKAKGAS
jgi:thioredoxin-related protein